LRGLKCVKSKGKKKKSICRKNPKCDTKDVDLCREESTGRPTAKTHEATLEKKITRGSQREREWTGEKRKKRGILCWSSKEKRKR